LKRWLISIGEEEDMEKEVVMTKVPQHYCELLSRAGVQLEDIDVLSYVERQGSCYESGSSQVVLYGQALRQHFGLVKIVFRQKFTKQYLLLVFDLTVSYMAYLGLYKLYPDDVTPFLIKFEDLTTSEPLNFYTSRDFCGEEFNYVALKEALILK